MDDLVSRYSEKIAKDLPQFPMKLKDVARYVDWKEKNTDSYGNACFEFAEQWAMLMEIEIEKGKPLTTVMAETACRKADENFGITGFMYGAAKSILFHCWLYGDELMEINP